MNENPPRIFCHAGDRGDLIYALPAIRAACGIGGATILLHPWVDGHPGPRPAAKPLQLFHDLRLLLVAQSYVRHLFVADFNQLAENLNLFRCGLGARGYSIAEIYCVLLGVDRGEVNKRWLAVQPRHVADVVVHRSLHHHGRDFPWQRVRDAYRGRAVMVGSLAELAALRAHADWEDLEYVPTADLCDVAQVIAGGKLFIGNQSAPYAIAEAMKVDTIQETCLEAPNCIFDRPNARYFPRDSLSL